VTPSSSAASAFAAAVVVQVDAVRARFSHQPLDLPRHADADRVREDDLVGA
jgi:hypothetical protein